MAGMFVNTEKKIATLQAQLLEFPVKKSVAYEEYNQIVNVPAAEELPEYCSPVEGLCSCFHCSDIISFYQSTTNLTEPVISPIGQKKTGWLVPDRITKQNNTKRLTIV